MSDQELSAAGLLTYTLSPLCFCHLCATDEFSRPLSADIHIETVVFSFFFFFFLFSPQAALSHFTGQLTFVPTSSPPVCR